ncbi:Succinyl-CoA ligase [ADP-forming] subunit beta [Colletotrichum chlorophyti]|uniref:Succinyl-CoA ligase [ADP-forming] subunit beta n=1 Tax=Colletotrichum chlorophyti TaxID=708187 RepID=A0A1Q8RQ64_9PEZI|nr:Succinyl-CoA ligase [ADP-forming] subunit beta [Colletotrichum chlorophyti]
MASRALNAKLWKFGVPVLKEKLARRPDEAAVLTKELRGGIGKGSTISLNDYNTESTVNSSRMKPGSRIQLAPNSNGDLAIGKLHSTDTIKYEDKWYLAMTFDRENYCPVIIASKSSEDDTQKISMRRPRRLETFAFTLTGGVTPDIVQKVSNFLGVYGTEVQTLRGIIERLYKIFTSKDATLLEINPLVRSSEGDLLCLNASCTFDDAAAKRQEDLFAKRDVENGIPEEAEAERYGLVYVKMEGDIGNVVNGAGLAMATNDAIALHGGASANFLDAGGQATKETMVKAFEIILRDKRVKTVLVNIYGGITKGDMIAESIIGAATELGPLRVPMVVRLQGTNSDLGLKIASCCVVESGATADAGL